MTLTLYVARWADTLMIRKTFTLLALLILGASAYEYTDDHITDQFRDNGSSLLLDRLTSLPCLFCEEGTEDETAYVGQINRARIAGKDLSLEISFDTEVPSFRS